jgi:hypothetical protein
MVPYAVGANVYPGCGGAVTALARAAGGVLVEAEEVDVTLEDGVPVAVGDNFIGAVGALVGEREEVNVVACGC